VALGSADLAAVRRFLEEFTVRSLLPHLEARLRAVNFQVSPCRRRIWDLEPRVPLPLAAVPLSHLEGRCRAVNRQIETNGGPAKGMTVVSKYGLLWMCGIHFSRNPSPSAGQSARAFIASSVYLKTAACPHQSICLHTIGDIDAEGAAEPVQGAAGAAQAGVVVSGDSTAGDRKRHLRQQLSGGAAPAPGRSGVHAAGDALRAHHQLSVCCRSSHSDRHQPKCCAGGPAVRALIFLLQWRR
jgi:hypothetical protein